MRTEPLNRIDRRYMEWREAYPNVMDMFRQFAGELLNRDKRFGIALLADRVRWETHFDYDGEEFKVNNNYTPYIMRDLIQEMPELEDLVQTRAIREDDPSYDDHEPTD